MWSRKSAPPRKGGFFWDELDAASGVRNDRGRDPDGNDSAACAVRPEGPSMAKPAIGITKKWKSST